MNRGRAYVMMGPLVAGALTLVSACKEHDDTSLFVKQVLAPKLVSPGVGCVFTSDPTQAYITSGVLDVALSPGGYTAEFLLGNQLVPEANPNVPTTETSYINVAGAVVTVTDSAGNVLGSFTRLTTAVIPPSSGGIPTFSPVGVLIVDPVSLSKLTVLSTVPGAVVRVVASVQFFGETLGHQSIESDTFQFPVDVCKSDPANGYSCLVAFTTADIKPGCGLLNCLGNGTTTSTSNAQVPCELGQDLAVDCSQCLGLAVCDPNEAVCAAAGQGDGGAP
jgi:hypothetical protein